MPTEHKRPIPVGTKVTLKASLSGVKGIKYAEGVFMSDEFVLGLHNGSGRGPDGRFWYCTDSSLEPYDVQRKKTGFAKFIEKVEKPNA